MSIQSIGTSLISNNIGINKASLESGGEDSFSKVMSDALSKVNDVQVNADNKIESFIKGDDVAMHDVMLAMQESQLSMQLLVEVRNKVVEAYQEINRVQL